MECRTKLEGNTLNDEHELAEMLKDADSVIVLVQQGGELALYYSSELDELMVLDAMAAVTAKLYHTLDSTPHSKH
jgi:hypothetical protein